MGAREENTSEGRLSAQCISLLEEVKDIIEGRRDPATNTPGVPNRWIPITDIIYINQYNQY